MWTRRPYNYRHRNRKKQKRYLDGSLDTDRFQTETNPGRSREQRWAVRKIGKEISQWRVCRGLEQGSLLKTTRPRTLLAGRHRSGQMGTPGNNEFPHRENASLNPNRYRLYPAKRVCAMLNMHGAGKMVQQVIPLVTKPDNLSSMSRPHMVKRKNSLPQVVPWPSHVCCPPPYTHTHKHT